jgi:hypothetical protein
VFTNRDFRANYVNVVPAESGSFTKSKFLRANGWLSSNALRVTEDYTTFILSILFYQDTGANIKKKSIVPTAYYMSLIVREGAISIAV